MTTVAGVSRDPCGAAAARGGAPFVSLGSDDLSRRAEAVEHVPDRGFIGWFRSERRLDVLANLGHELRSPAARERGRGAGELRKVRVDEIATGHNPPLLSAVSRSASTASRNPVQSAEKAPRAELPAGVIR